MVRGKKGNNSKFIRGKRGDRKQDRVPTLPVGAAWEVLEEFDLSQLLKLAANSPQVEDLVWCGALNEYDEAYDKISGRNPKNIRKSENKVFYSVTSQEDPILEGFAAEEKGNVFVTDTILAQLMAAPRSVYSWDIVVQKVGGMIFLDKRNDSNIDMLTVSETALDAPTLAEDIEEFNYPEALSQEATAINQNFSQQILRSGNLKSVSHQYLVNLFTWIPLTYLTGFLMF